jgi:hypothetical protein
VVAHAGVRMPLAHHAAGGGGASGLRGAVVGSPPKTPVPRRSADQPNRRAAGLSPSARPSLEVRPLGLHTAVFSGRNPGCLEDKASRARHAT